jgi:hypothetical protein
MNQNQSNNTTTFSPVPVLGAGRLASLASKKLSDCRNQCHARLASLEVGSNVLFKLLAGREEAVGGSSVGNDNVPVDKPVAKKMENQHQVFLGIAQHATSQLSSPSSSSAYRGLERATIWHMHLSVSKQWGVSH